MVIILLLITFVFVSCECHNSNNKNNGSNGNSLPILIIDVDNTLYNESKVGIESQIVQNTHEFARKYFDMDSNEADELFHEYGSTIEGLRARMMMKSKEHKHPLFNSMDDLMDAFYKEVYSDDNIDLSSLLLSDGGGDESVSANDSTGYTHNIGNGAKFSLLSNLADQSPVWLASNSSKQHVERVLRFLGLSKNRVPIAGILTPDCEAFSHLRNVPQSCFPTKHQATTFWAPLIQKYHSNQKFFLLEDSKNNLNQAREAGMSGFLIKHDAQSTFQKGLETYLQDCIEIINVDGSLYKFSDIKYLESKNKVDEVSINSDLWMKVLEEVEKIHPDNHILRVVDLGAGLLNMFEKLIGDNGIKGGNINHLYYTAYESNQHLIAKCHEKLAELGYEAVSENVFQGLTASGVEVNICLKSIDFAEDISADAIHLVIGSCFADLYEPNTLTTSLYRFLNLGSKRDEISQSTLIYFPITFSGTTSFFPPSSFDTLAIPSDTIAFQLYAKSLMNMGHTLDPFKIVHAMEAYGSELLYGVRSSNWNIKFEANPYLWNTMIHFFCSSSIPELYSQKWNAVGWINRALQKRPDIHVTNVDLLFRVNSHDSRFCEGSTIIDTAHTFREIEFQSPRKVGTKIKHWDGKLAPNQIEVETVCSLISSGTELKVFNGLFDRAALDVNINGFSDTEMSYPLTYGYSSVGRVVRCGISVPDAESLIDKLVFSFSQHSDRLIIDREAVQVVPNGIEANDAIFMPSVETALSLVHDSNVRIGERVAIYGQGLIGLLVTGLLSINKQSLQHKSGDNHKFGSITAFDMVRDRLAYASLMGATEGLLPMEAIDSGPFDVSIEISGNGKALQTAIDNTSNGGRIILGSWYGNKEIQLKLGIDFHRSHKTIITSQVSEISAALTSLWSKERRFALTWELVKKLKPSRLITRTVSLSEAQDAYERLDSGKEIAISFKYS